MKIGQHEIRRFHEAVWGYYAVHGRTGLPWRLPEQDGSFDPYKIMVSELMLQQTQVARVIPKYRAFLERFPTVQTLAQANLGDVLRTWQGLGYNRRAKFLWQAAQQVGATGQLPGTVEGLVKLPGVGVNTAGAILAYAFDVPAVFIETNVRTVFIHHFFQDRGDVEDKEIRLLLEQTLDAESPREFYWALMDYGSYLKATVGNLSRASKHFTKQSIFHGSRRQLRGQVIRALGAAHMTERELSQAYPDERLAGVLQELVDEGMIHRVADTYSLD